MTLITCTTTNSANDFTNSSLVVNTGTAANRALVLIETCTVSGSEIQATNVHLMSGEVFTLVGHVAHQDFGVDGGVWRLVNPPSNVTTNVVVQYNDQPSYMTSTIFVLSGVNQTTPVSSLQSFGIGDPSRGHTNTVSSSGTAVVVDAFFVYDVDVGTTVTIRAPLTNSAAGVSGTMNVYGNAAAGSTTVSCGFDLSASEGRIGHFSMSVDP